MSHPLFKDLTGQTFGRLTALHRVPDQLPGRTTWKCRCICGVECDALATNIKSGKTRSCGCLNRERASKVWRTHGRSHTTEHIIWMGMISRCTQPSNHAYESYGGRGITVCEAWRTFENFYRDMGDRPPGASIDRINNDGPYSPDNCHWATMVEQQNNRRGNTLLTFQGETRTVSGWARKIGISATALTYRINKGWPLEDAISGTYVRCNAPLEHIDRWGHVNINSTCHLPSRHPSGRCRHHIGK